MRGERGEGEPPHGNTAASRGTPHGEVKIGESSRMRGGGKGTLEEERMP